MLSYYSSLSTLPVKVGSNALIFYFFSEGDCNSCIHLWEPASDATWNVDPNPFIGHAASVEDLQVRILYVKRYYNFLAFFCT